MYRRGTAEAPPVVSAREGGAVTGPRVSLSRPWRLCERKRGEGQQKTGSRSSTNYYYYYYYYYLENEDIPFEIVHFQKTKLINTKKKDEEISNRNNMSVSSLERKWW